MARLPFLVIHGAVVWIAVVVAVALIPSGNPHSMVIADPQPRRQARRRAAQRLDFPTVTVLLGKGDGTLQDNTDYATGRLPALVVAGDLDGDGVLDLVGRCGARYGSRSRW
jgi:hypothetical protein